MKNILLKTLLFSFCWRFKRHFVALCATQLLICNSFLQAQNLPSYLPANGLVGWWPFNGNANDESGNELTSTSSGISFTADRFGNAGSAAVFNGNGSVKTPFSQQISPANFPNYSISLWFRRNVHNANERMIFQYKEGELGPAGTSNFDFHESRIDWCGDNKSAFYHYPYWPNYSCSPSISELGIWNHVTLIFNQSTDSVRFYLNGNYWFSSPVNNDFPGQGYLIFGNNASDEFAFTGDLDDIAVYNRALSQQEITALYQGGSASTSCPVLPANLQQGLKGYWPFCGNAIDESGNGNNGTVSGAMLAADRFGNPAKAYFFDGNNDVINTNLSSGFSNQFTIQAWVKTSSLEEAGIVSSRTSQIQFNGLYYSNTQKAEVWISSPSLANYISAPPPINDNKWHHVLGVFNGTSGKIFLDGVLENTSNTQFNISINSPFFFGYDNFPNQNRYFNGLLDDIAIWNRALSPEEITQLYEIQSCATPLAVSISGAGIQSANPGGNLQLQAQAGSAGTSYRWQAEAAEMGWNNIPENSRYHGVDSARLQISGIGVANHLQKFRVIGKSGGCADTSGTVLLQVSDTCITSISDTSFVTIYDTSLVSVTDTLIINTIITASNPGISNTLKAWPNPTAGMLFINTGNFASMAGYSIRISSAAGQLVYESPVNLAMLEIPLDSFGANGLYYLRLFRPNGELVTTRKIVLQQ